MESREPTVSLSSGSVSVRTGFRRAKVERDHGMSVVFGSANDIVPIAPAALRFFHLSAADWECAAKGAGNVDATRQEDGNFALEINSLEVVDLGFRDA